MKASHRHKKTVPFVDICGHVYLKLSRLFVVFYFFSCTTQSEDFIECVSPGIACIPTVLKNLRVLVGVSWRGVLCTWYAPVVSYSAQHGSVA